MLRDKQKTLSQSLLSLFVITLAMVNTSTHAELTSLAKNDALPMFSTLNLDDALLLTKDYLYYIDDESADKKHNRVGIYISPFAQSADRGKTIKGSVGCPPPVVDECELTLTDTPLGDLTGRTGMIALLYGNRPAGSDNLLPGGADGALSRALFGLFELEPTQIVDPEDDEVKIDPDQFFGFFSFPLKYRKRGLRIEMAARVYKNFGVRIQTGFSTIRQVREETIDLTKEDITFEGLSGADVDLYLMDELNTIATEMGYNLCDFIETSMEEIRFNLFWRQTFEINKEADSDWARFLLIPYVEAAASVSPGKKQDYHKFFSVPFGNNTHSSAGITAGINFNFLETIEIGGEAGWTHFFEKDFYRPIPNSPFQTNLFPYSTNVSVQPGDSWYFGARIAAYHFIDKLSMYFEWFVLDHQQDHICLTCPDPAFLPEVLECTTSFKTKLGNAGFNYDLSPNIAVGFLWQIPFSQRNSYRSSTLMGGFNVTF
jgi:hypothetical protein